MSQSVMAEIRSQKPSVETAKFGPEQQCKSFLILFKCLMEGYRPSLLRDYDAGVHRVIDVIILLIKFSACCAPSVSLGASIVLEGDILQEIAQRMLSYGNAEQAKTVGRS